jgi:hypothetical protein
MRKLVIGAMVLAFVAGTAPVSHAQSASQQSEIAGATTGLGTTHRFKTEDAASRHCPGDTVVWSSGPALNYSLPGAVSYGKGAGFYACKMEADDAGFHSMPQE